MGKILILIILNNIVILVIKHNNIHLFVKKMCIKPFKDSDVEL